MQQLRTASEKGHYLRPYAKIMLALADLREKNEIEARKLLEELTREFPENHLFAKELAKVNQRPAQSTTSQ
jgi:predicted Zn-dependent protease